MKRGYTMKMWPEYGRCAEDNSAADENTDKS